MTTTVGTGGDWRDERARPWGETVERVLTTEWPWGSAHMSLGPDDCDVTPRRLHPAFYASLDWHSSAHMQWSAMRLLATAREQLGEELMAALTAQLDERLTAEHGRVEADYLLAHPRYERPYGWGWAALLHAEAMDGSAPGAQRWEAGTTPVAEAIATNLLAWLPRQAYPVRHGVHANSAFALALAHEAFGRLGRSDVVAAIEARARDWFAGDRDYPAHYEPSGEDFLSGALTEADLMRRVLPADEMRSWLEGFLPGLGAEGDPLLTVPEVLDRTDGKMVHLFGLAISRAWALRGLLPFVAPDRAERMRAAAGLQLAAVEEEISHGDFMSTHWLVSFAILAEQAGEQAGEQTVR